MAGSFYAHGDSDVFEDFASYAGVAADAILNIAADHQKLAVSGGRG